MIKATRSMENTITRIMAEAESPEQAAAQIAELMAEMAYTAMREGKGQPMLEIWRHTLDILGMEEEQEGSQAPRIAVEKLDDRWVIRHKQGSKILATWGMGYATLEEAYAKAQELGKQLGC